MTWYNLNFGYQSILTSAKMQQMQSNLTSFANGDSGSPKVIEDGIANNAITGAKINAASYTKASYNLPGSTTYYPSVGVFQTYCNLPVLNVRWEMRVSGTWRVTTIGSNYGTTPIIINDGLWRVVNVTAGTVSFIFMIFY